VSDPLSRARAAADFVRRRASRQPKVGLILGSGLGEFADRLSQPVVLPYAEIPEFPTSTVVGHAGELVLGRHHGLEVAVLKGRVHFYEGYPLEQVVFPTRVLGLLGVEVLVVTNAAGGINASFRPGQLMLITDHINLIGGSPLRGANQEGFGPRFPDLSEAYHAGLRRRALAQADRLRIGLQHGVYAALFGPNYETPAEIRMLKALGADAVGMSTVPEVIAANHMGLKVLGISCITNMAAGILAQKIEHAEVLETTTRVKGEFIALLGAVLDDLAEGGLP
jgi:purine-nucleoside phosphorylase